MTREYPKSRARYIIESESTYAQELAEDECSPFFVNLATMPFNQLDHLREVGLLPPLRAPQELPQKVPSTPGLSDGKAASVTGKAAKLLGLHENEDKNDEKNVVILEEDRHVSPLMDDTNGTSGLCGSELGDRCGSEVVGNALDEPGGTIGTTADPYSIRLVRKKHVEYLTRALEVPLSKGFVSLDASHPWMIYWCLHSLDLLGYFDDFQSNSPGGDDGSDTRHDINTKSRLLERVVSTLHHCWTDAVVPFSQQDIDRDVRLQLLPRKDSKLKTSTDFTNKNDATYQTNETKDTKWLIGGGFGGGPNQIPHCAPTYAAVLALSIVASLGSSYQHSSGHSNPYCEASKLAMQLLQSKSLPMYAFFLSLREWQLENRLAFRMQHDGEIDVRASYCILAPSYLLGLLRPGHHHTKNEKNNDDNHYVSNSDCNNNPLLSPAIVHHIASCQTYEGGFGAEPFSEAHGGYTFCALSALRLLAASEASNMSTVPVISSINVHALHSWLARRQMGYEGGFCGRTNKLVDGCYSFWQGGAMAVLDGWLQNSDDSDDCDVIKTAGENEKSHGNVSHKTEIDGGRTSKLTYDEVMLQRYILLCAQDVSGGLRDKPSKPRDFYHTCYNLSGLSVSQHSLRPWPPTKKFTDNMGSPKGQEEQEILNCIFGDESVNIVGRTDPVLNIRVKHVKFMLSQQFF